MSSKENSGKKQRTSGESAISGNISLATRTGFAGLILLACMAALLLVFTALPGEAAQEIVQEARLKASDTGGPAYGVVFMTSAEGQADEQQLANAQATGASWDRWPIYWFNVETSVGVFDWSRQDRAVQDDMAHGLQLNAILLGTPAFYTTSFLQQPSLPYLHQPRQGTLALYAVEKATPQGLFEPVFLDGDTPGPNKVINPNNKWAVFVEAAVNRYKPGGELGQANGWPEGKGITHWEMWNEPDLPFFWDAGVADYARLLKVGYLAAKHADAEAQVMFGGLAMFQNPSFYDQVLDLFDGDSLAKAQSFFHDIATLHNYFVSERTATYARIINGSMAGHGLDKSLWVNESGVPAWDDYPGPVWEPLSPLRATQQEQADFAIQSAFYGISAGADALFHFQLYDGCGNQPQGTDFPPHEGELCDENNNYNGKPCAGDANGLYRNPNDAACFTQHPQAETPRPVFSAFKILTTHVTNVEPYWQKRAGTPLYSATCPGSDGPQEWIALYQPTTRKRVVGLWARCERSETAVVESTDPSGKALLVRPDGSAQEIVAVNGSYTITLPRATNRNPFPGQTINPTFAIGGRPAILIETDYRGNPPTPTATATSTAIPSQTPTATPTTAPGCEQAIINGDFEEDTGWRMPLTPYQARYSTAQASSGNRSMQVGIIEAQDNVASYSTALQTITVPLNPANQMLRAQLYMRSSESGSLSLPTDLLSITAADGAVLTDFQMVLLLDANGQTLRRLLVDRLNVENWQPYSFDLSEFAGQTVQIYFGAYNNGVDGVTGMYIDEVTLDSCAAATPTATPTATKTPPTNGRYEFFAPLVVNDHPLGISGRIVDADGQAVEGVAIRTKNGFTTLNEPSGHYGFRDLVPGTYVVIPEKEGYAFRPPERELSLPPGAPMQDFLAIPPPPTVEPYPAP